MLIGLTILMFVVVASVCCFLGYVAGHLRGYLVGRSEACRIEPPTSECIDKEIRACTGKEVV